MINKDFLRSLKSATPAEAVVGITEYYFNLYSNYDSLDDRYLLSVEVMGLLSTLSKKYKLNIGPPQVKGSKSDYVSTLYSYISNKQSEFRVIYYNEHVSDKSEKYASILFDESILCESDVENIQDLLLKLREVVDATTEISEDIKCKIIENIAAIEKQLHGIVIDLPKIMGLLVPLWMLAKEAKDAFEIVKIVMDIVGKAIAQSNGLELPPGQNFNLLE